MFFSHKIKIVGIVMTNKLLLKFKSINSEKQEVEGIVYKANTIDAHGEFITHAGIKAIKKMCDDAISKGKSIIDTNHDKIPNGSEVLENYFNGDDKTNDDYELGDWIQKVKIHDSNLWERVKSGELNAFSINFMASEEEVEADVLIELVKYSVTDSNVNDHEHKTFIRFDEFGKSLGGRTSDHEDEEGNIHYHLIDHTVKTSKTIYKKGLGGDHPHRVKS